MGYWLLVAMIVCAIIIVLVVGSGDFGSANITSDEPEHNSSKRNKRRVRWTAIVRSGSDSADRLDWPGLVARSYPNLELDLLSANPLTVGSLRERLVCDGAEADLVSLWVGLDDILAGTRLPIFERDLGLVLGDLAYRGTSCIVGTIPELGRLGLSAAEGLSSDDLRLLTVHWNTAIARVAADFGCTVVDLFDVYPRLRIGQDRDDAPHSDAVERAIARRFAPAIDAAVMTVSTATADADDQPSPASKM